MAQWVRETVSEIQGWIQMSDAWFTIEQAAVRLGISVRTINRHINAGKLQSRLNEGRREVFVAASIGRELKEAGDIRPIATQRPDDPPPVSKKKSQVEREEVLVEPREGSRPQPPQPEQSVPPSPTAATSISTLDSETMLALADNWADRADLAANAYQTLVQYSETRAAELQRSNRIAWSAVSVITIGILIAVAWTTRQLTLTTVENQVLKTRIETAVTSAENAKAQLDEKSRKTKEELEEVNRKGQEEAQRLRDLGQSQVQSLSVQLLTVSQELAHLRGRMEANSKAYPTTNPSENVTSEHLIGPKGGPTTNTATSPPPINLATRPIPIR